LWPNFRQLRILSTEEQEETKSDIRNLIEEFKRDEELGPTAVTPGNLWEESVSDSYQHKLQARSRRFGFQCVRRRS
jgi:hypothetical protein